MCKTFALHGPLAFLLGNRVTVLFRYGLTLCDRLDIAVVLKTCRQGNVKKTFYEIDYPPCHVSTLISVSHFSSQTSSRTVSHWSGWLPLRIFLKQRTWQGRKSNRIIQQDFILVTFLKQLRKMKVLLRCFTDPYMRLPSSIPLCSHGYWVQTTRLIIVGNL